jgi:hypothetical protein
MTTLRYSLRYSLLLGTALLTVAGAADAQQQKRPREDLLDALTRHIQICAEISDSQGRLSCYDKLQTDVGDVSPRAPTPTPLASNPPPPAMSPSSPPPPPPPPSTSAAAGQVGQAPLAPPPLMVPGGGAATLGGNAPSSSIYAPPPGSPTPLAPPPPAADPDAAFNPRNAATAYQQPGMPRPQSELRRTGPRPVPNYGANMPVVSLQVNNLTYGASRYWQVTVGVTSNVNRTVDTQVQCSFLNGGRSVGDATLGPVQLAAGEQVSTDLIGPPTTVFVDSTNCRVLSP